MTGPCTETPIFDQLFTEVEPETQRLVLVAVADRPRPAPALDGPAVQTFAEYMASLTRVLTPFGFSDGLGGDES